MIRLLALIPAVFLTACNQVTEGQVHDIVARVGGDNISAEELDYQASRLTGKDAASVLNNAEQRRQLIESMALTLLFAQKQQATMSADQLRQIDLATQAYRRELLAKEYIGNNLSRKVPTQKDVEDYYASHPDRFGGGTDYILKVLSLSDQCAIKPGWLNSSADQPVMPEAEQLDCEKKTSTIRGKFSQLKEVYPSLPDSLIVGQEYWVHSGPMQELLYIESKKEGNPKPLAEVSAEIRKLLAPSFLRKAIQEEQLKFSKEIEYFD